MRHRVHAALRLAGALAGALALPAAHGCTDVGDSSAPGVSAITGGDDDGAAGEANDANANEDASPGAPGEDASSGETDAAFEDGSTQTVGAAEAGADDAETQGVSDAGSEDAADAGAPDATIVDSGAADAGVVDAGKDAAPSSGSDSGAGADAGYGSDAAAAPDAAQGGGGLAPCTTAGQTDCVQCQYNDGAEGSLPNATQLCTPTEAALVEHDIAVGNATAAGPDPSGSCYQCAALSGCLDDSEFADSDHECEDLSGSASQGECEATLKCILASSCGFVSQAVSTCYCGTAPVSGSCAAVGGSNAANGACASAEAAGLGFAANDGLDILKNFTSTTLPSGVANNIFQCAVSNQCTTCLH